MYTYNSVLPGGRNSGQKAQKGPEKKKFGRKNLWPNYGRISSKVAEKGPKKFFERISCFYCNDKHSKTMKQNCLQFYWPFGWTLFCVLCVNWPDFFQIWPNFFHLLAGKKFRDLATLVQLHVQVNHTRTCTNARGGVHIHVQEPYTYFIFTDSYGYTRTYMYITYISMSSFWWLYASQHCKVQKDRSE